MPDLGKLEELWKHDNKDFFWLCDNFLPCVLGSGVFENNFVKTNTLLWKEVSHTDLAFVIYVLLEKAIGWEEKYTHAKQNKEEGKSPPQEDELSSVSQDGCKGGKTKKQRINAYKKVEKLVLEMKQESGDDIATKYREHRADIIKAREEQKQENKDKKRKREEEPEEEPVSVDEAML